MMLAATRAPGKAQTCTGTVQHWSRFVVSAHSLRRAGHRPLGPRPGPSISGEVGPGAEPYPPAGCWAKPDLGTGADAMRHLYDHTDVIGELGRASTSGTPDSTAAASFGKRGAAWTGAGADR